MNAEQQFVLNVKTYNHRKGRYGFEVEYEGAYAGITLQDRDLGFQLAEMASRIGNPKYIKLNDFRPKPRRNKFPKVLIDYPVVPDLWSPPLTSNSDVQKEQPDPNGSPRFIIADSDGRIFIFHLQHPFFFGEVLFSGSWSRAHFKLETTFTQLPPKKERDQLIREAEDFYWKCVKGEGYQRRKKPSDLI